jgi:porphobilinogen synthase
VEGEIPSLDPFMNDLPEPAAPQPAGYPRRRMRRLRQDPRIRALARLPDLSPGKWIQPLFIREGNGVREEVPSMPGVCQWSPDRVGEPAGRAAELGLGGVILFGIPARKDERGSASWDESGVIPQAIRAVKAAAPELLVVTDLCFCEYTDHGHCGLLTKVAGRTDVDNDGTLALLGRQAAAHARAGSDMLAPSGMMDGMVGVVRSALDEAGYAHLPVMSYAAKYASSFYGPFRDAAESAPAFGDRRSYQMDPAADPGQALREVELDLAEGADLVMVKPALAYLDVIRMVRDRFPGVPIVAYNVSGEYSMLRAAARLGWLDERAAAIESLTAIHRAGAGIIITYWAEQAAGWLRG